MRQRALTSALLLVVLAGRVWAEPAVDIGRDYPLEAGWRRIAHQISAELDAVPPGKRVVYLSGPISSGGAGDVRANLSRGNSIADELRAAGYHVISPFEMEQNLRVGQPNRWKLHATFMKLWSTVLDHPRIDEVVVVPNAEGSFGVAQEIGLFIAQGRPVSTYRDRKGGFRLEPLRYHPLLGRVEHTLLAPGATEAEILKETRWARRHGLRAMVVRPEHVERVAAELRGRQTVTAAVIGFPRAKFTSLADFPRVPTAEKLRDAVRAIDGARAAGAKVVELDMILDVHALKGGDYAQAERDLHDVIEGARAYGGKAGVAVRTKVIVETSLLTRRDLEIASAIVRRTNAFSIKSSTGYGPRGVRVADARTMKRIIGGTMLIKLSAGVSKSNLGVLSPYGHIFGMGHGSSRDLVSPRGRRAPARSAPGGRY